MKNRFPARSAAILAATLVFFLSSSAAPEEAVQTAPSAEASKPAEAEGITKPEELKNETPAQARIGLEEVHSCITDPVVVDDLRKRKDELDAREKELKAREVELSAKAKAIEEEIQKMEGIRADMAKIDQSRKKDNEERVAKLVETVQLMSPKGAAQLVTHLDEGLAVATLSKMDSIKLAKILNLMEPAKSSRLSELLAGVVRARGEKPLSLGRADTAITTASAARGGEKNDNTTNTGNSSTSPRTAGSDANSGGQSDARTGSGSLASEGWRDSRWTHAFPAEGLGIRRS